MNMGILMHRVLYNSCYGGYGLSPEAGKWMCDKLGLPFNESRASCGSYYGYFDDSVHQAKWESNTKRHSPLLLECFDELGSDRFSGMCAEVSAQGLYGSMYAIDEYDGIESVEQPSDGNEWINAND